MMILVIAVIFTLTVSAVCSLLEAVLLSITPVEIEVLKQEHPRAGKLMEQFCEELGESSSAILALNTIANTLGAVIVGGLATRILGDANLVYFSIGLTLAILIFSEIVPKNVGVIYRTKLLRSVVFLFYGIRFIMRPISRLGEYVVWIFLQGKKPPQQSSDAAIILMAEKGAKEGGLTTDERDMVANALRLHDVHIDDIMTPRTVVSAVESNWTLTDVANKFPNIPFARLPVFEEDIGNVVGVIRRRDFLKLNLQGEDKDRLVADIMQKPLFLPESGSVGDALRECLKNHQQFAVVVDEFGSMAGVISMEDIFEYIIGKEIFEKDDVAIDMRELARKQKKHD